MKSEDFVRGRFQSTLPPDVPLPFEVVKSRFDTVGANIRSARAEVVMFDGEPAELSIKVTYGRTEYRWLRLAADCSYENGKWVRIDP